MHANADIWEIRQIEVAKEAKMMMGTMELVAQSRATMVVKGRTAAVETRIRRKMTILRTARAITKAPVPVPATLTRTMITISMIFTTDE
jgi:hypothetical protein